MDQPRHVFKRVKERSIMDAKHSVDQWRSLFKYGERDQNGNKIKYSLKQAAEKVGVPKKTLEDYHQLLKKAEQIIDLNEIGDKKMGFLRNLLKYPQQQQMQGGAYINENISKIGEMEEQDEAEFPQQYEQQLLNIDDMFVDGDVNLFPYENPFEQTEQYIQTVMIPQQLNYDKKLEITYSDCDDCETNDEFDDE